MSAWLSRWFKKTLPITRRPARGKAPRPAGRLALESLEDRLVMTASLQVQGLPPGQYVNSYAGVGLQENQVGILYAQVNGQADTNKSDFQAQINWGDGSSSPADLVYVGNNGSSAEFLIKGSHVYGQINSHVPISVSVAGEGAAIGGSASNLTTYANIYAMPSGFPGTTPAPVTPTMAPSDVHLQV